jgi:A/G-specific adenine glycosylase
MDPTSDPQEPMAAALLAWYDRHRRDLPWRATTQRDVSPYQTWVSEVMLQQTRVDAVIPYYERFIDRFPTVNALADAAEDDVLALWSGLGYYSRARNLHRGAQQVRDEGAFPAELEGLRALAGVGPYIAGAIGSIALGLDVAAVDGNVERVISRVHGLPGGRKVIEDVAAGHLPVGRAGDFNQALMDLGSDICLPRSPRCSSCPLLMHCVGGQSGSPEQWPVRTPKRAAPEREAIGLLTSGPRGVLLVRRPSEGLYGGLFDLPWRLVERGEERAAVATDLADRLRDRLGLTLDTPGAEVVSVHHVLTHMRLHLTLIAVRADPLELPSDARWVGLSEPDGVGISTLCRKALAAARPLRAS